MTDTALPKELTPLNLLAYLMRVFGACGCSEIKEMVAEIHHLLRWVGDQQEARSSIPYRYDTLYPDRPGVYYLLMGRLDDLGLVEHGVSIRYPMLSGDGKRLLQTLATMNLDEIEEASGEAYDGLWYGDGE